MKTVLLIVAFSLLLKFPLLFAQSSYRLGILPQMNINFQITDTWEINASIEARQLLYEGYFGEKAIADYSYILTDISLLTATRIGGSKIAGGYLMRIDENKMIHRFIQGLSIVLKYSSFRLGHRFVLDQTLEKDIPAEFRFRYRISIDRALNGLSVDPREFYFKANLELLNSLQDNSYGLEIRLVPSMGFAFTDNNKVELGLGYRLDEFIDSEGSRNTLWLNIGWYLSL